MVKLISRTGSRASRFLMITAMTGLLVSCGGGSGDTADEADLDGDGIVNTEDDDADGDGVLDFADPFVDLDGDGFDDFTGQTEFEATNTEEVIEGEVVNGDTDGDGFTDVSDTAVCGGESGSDNNSSTAVWDDNCFVKRATINGQFARSFYAVGIQRVLYCSGFGEASSYSAFADGIYGENTEAAVEDFQRAEVIAVDGIVGTSTWGRLRDRISLLTYGIVGVDPDAYGFEDGPCADTALFYQHTSPAADGVSSPIPGRWELARNAPNESQQIEFSISAAAGL